MKNPYDEIVAQDLGQPEKSDNPYDALINQDIGNLQTMARQRAMRAAMTDASKAKRNQELSERIGTPADLVDAAPELIEQSLKADDISEQLSKFPPEQQQWFLQNQNLEALQDDLPRLNALRDAIENKAWYEQSWYERNIKAPVAKGLFRLRSSFNATEIQTNVEAVTVGESVKKFMTENGLDMAVQPDVSEIGQRYQAWLDAGGSEFSDREKRIAQSYLEMPSQIQGRIDEGKNALPVNIRDLSESETAQSYIPMDPNTPETEGFFETIGYMLAENPGMIPRETITSFVQSAPALAAGYLTGGGSLVATAGAAGAGSFAVEQPMKLIEVLREAGYDLNDPEQALAAFNDRELMAEAREKANKKAAGVAGTDALLAFVGGSMLMPGRVGARTLTQAERNLGNQLIQAPIQAAGEGTGEAVGQYWSEGEIDMAEVALETVIGGATSPVEVLTYGAGHYRRGKQAREYLTRINEIANEARQGNAGEKQIHDFVKMAKEQGPLSEVYIDAQELKDILDQTGLDPDSIVERMPAVAEQYYEALAIGGDLSISLEEFTSVLGDTAAVEHLIDAVRVDPNGMSARQADEWLKGDGQAMLEQVLLSNVEDPATPASKIMDDLTGQLVGAGYSQGVAETEAERMATTFVRIAAMAGKDPMEVYEKYGPKIRRDTGEAGRKVRQTTELDNMLDRLRGGEIPTAKDVYGQSLIEFLRDQGGVVDEGGELSAIDADVGREAFQRNLIQMTGMTLDEAAEKLVEAGFMQERDPNQLLEMIANEVRGTPVYAPGNLNAENEALAADLEVLDTELRNMGLDIATLSNDEIIQALSELVTPATAPLEQPAFHGSPHSFDRFSLEAVGTGEGAQAYGHGLYFAGDRQVAEWYRKNLSGNRRFLSKMGVGFIMDGALETEYRDISDAKKDLVEGADLYFSKSDQEQFADQFGIDVSRVDDFVEALKNDDPLHQAMLEASIVAASEGREAAAQKAAAVDRRVFEIADEVLGEADGNIYEVEIPSDEDLLSWDDPLGEAESKFIGYAFWDDFVEMFPDEEQRTGAALYSYLSNQDQHNPEDDMIDVDPSASAEDMVNAWMKDAGYPGLKYLDGNSRAAGFGIGGSGAENNYNYVIWDEDVVTISAINDQAAQAENLAAAQGSVLEQSIEGSFVPFPDFYFEESVAEIMEEGIDRGAAERLAAKPRFAVPMDAVTGLIEGRRESADGVMDAERAVERAVQFVADTGGNAFYVSADVANLGGLNAHMNNVQARANVHYRALADILSEELAGTGGYVDGFRTGGDEFGAIVVGGDSQRVATAIAAAQVRVEAYKKAQGLDEFIHPKYPTDDSRRGLGLHLGYTQVVPGLSGKEVMELADTDMDASKKGEQSNVRRNQEEARREAVRDGRSQGAAAQARGASGPAQAGAGRSRARQLIADLIQRRNKLDQFVGESSLTADRDSLDAAKKMAADGKSQTQILNSTGWHKGVDGKWRYEISDDQAKFVAVDYPAAEDYMSDKDITYQPMESGIVKAIYGDQSRSDYMAAYGHTEQEAMENLAFHLMRDEFGKTFDPESSSESNHSLGDILDHPKLFAAYPWLASVSVRFRDLQDGVRGQLTTYGDIPVISVRADMPAEQKMSTLMHEVQHAIQGHEGFASGGMADAEFSATIKKALSQLEGKSDLAVKEWQWANDDKIKSADEAAERAKHALMFDSAQRLIEYAHHDRPSSVFRHIRNNLQWIYGVRGDDVANELQRMFYDIPKRHKSKERNKFLADMAMKGAQWLRDQMPEQTWKDFKSDDRTVKSMVKAMQREAERKSNALEPMRKLERQAQDARRVHEQSRFKTPVEIYYALAGEIEARNTQARLSMTEQERRDMSPERTADVPADEAIVIMGGLELQAPERMDSFTPDAVASSDAFQEWFGDSQVVDENGSPLVVYHGTTNDIEAFDLARANPESDMGAGIYFSNTPDDVAANYANEEGPDLTGRIEMTAERLASERDVDVDDVRDEARRLLSQGTPNTMPVYLSLQNPVNVGGDQETVFVIESVYDADEYEAMALEQIQEEFDIDDPSDPEVKMLVEQRALQLAQDNGDVIDESGSMIEFIEAMRMVAPEFQDVDVEQAISDILENGFAYDGMGASDLISALKQSEGVMYAMDDDGRTASNEFIRRSFEVAGYDGIVDKTVNKKFGDAPGGNMMTGVNPDSVHYIAFRPEQIKSASGNRGTFDRASANILEQPAFHGTPHKFDKFSLDAIGTGEGAQAYGWGLYFASKRGVADWYADRVGRVKGANFKYEGESTEATEQALKVVSYFENQADAFDLNDPQQMKEFISNVISVMEQDIAEEGATENLPIVEELKRMDAGKIRYDKGYLYQVDIPSDDQLIDWDKPLSEQPEAIKDVVGGAWSDLDAAREANSGGTMGSATGSEFYRHLVEREAERIDLDGLPDDAEMAASLRLSEMGIPGLRYLDGTSRGQGEGSYNYVIWDENAVTVEAVNDELVQAEALAQQRRGGLSRGQFFYDAMNQGVIQLGDAADLSTLTHESYHMFLDVMAELGTESQEVAGELTKIRKWLSRNPADLRRDAVRYAKQAGEKDVAEMIGAMDDKALKEFYETQQLSLRTLPPAGASRYLSVAGLEYFARAGEAYMLEGRAPSEGLAGVFRRMKQWFIQVYKTAKALKVNLSDDIIDVFDRMIATDEEIARAQRMAGYGTSLADVEGLQWTDEERETVAKLTGEAREQAERDLMREQLADMQKVNQKWWEDEKDKVRAEVLEELNRDAGYQARQMLTAGRRADGQSLPEGVEQIKLDRQALVDEFGIEYLRRLPSPKNPDNRAPQYVYAREGGQDPAMVARLYGFDSVRDLVEALINTRPVTPYVESLVEAEMRSRHPDINLSGEAAEIAMESVYNDKQAQAMLAELRKLESAAGRPETIPQLFRNKAKEVIAQKLVRDIKPQMYQSKAATFERESLREAIAGNYVEALQAKQKALMHHYIYREAVAARKEADKVYDYAKRLQKKSAQERIGKAGADYLDRINEILGKYEFRRVSIKDLNRRKSLLDWVAEKQEAGEHVDVPEAVIARAEQTNWREVPVEELLAAKDALKNLEHVARLKNRLQSDQAKRELQEVVDAVVKQVEKTKGKKRGKAFFEQKRLSEKAKDAGMDYASIALNMDSIIKSLDGFEDIGPVYEALKRPIDKASREVLPAMQEEYGDKLSKLFNDNYTRQEQRQMGKDGWVELKGRGSLSREQAIAVGLNWGNEYNREAVMAGIASGQDQLSEIEVRRILDSLEKQDWEFIQGVWDMMDHDLWPQVKAAQERRTGIAPEKVEATPVVTKHGVYRGGYYPVKFDRELGWRVTAQEAEEMAREVRMGGLAKAQTKRGHTIARTNTAGNPLKLDLGVLHGHVNQVLADLALGDAINDVARVANHRDFVAVMERTGNSWAIRVINNWLKDTAAQEVSGSDVVSKFARRVRTGFTISKLAWNIGTIALQPTGLFQTLPETGYRYMAKAIVDVSRGTWIGDGSIFNQVRQRSAFMKSRRASFNKDIELTQRAMKGSGWIEAVLEKTPLVKSMAGGMGPAKAADMIKESMMGGIVAVQQVVDTIVWLAAYEKGKGQFEADADAVQYADNIVARTQASGIFSDRTAFERGTLGDNTRQSEFVRMWTTLGSYMFAKANLAYQKTADTKFRDPGEVLRWMHDMFMLYISEAIFIAFLRNLWPDEDDDETAVGYLAKEGVNTLLSGMPIVRDGASALQGFQGGGAIGSFWDQVGKAGTQIGQGEVDAALLKSLNNVGGTIFRYPSGQMNRTLDALWRDMNGEDVEAVDYLLWRQDD